MPPLPVTPGQLVIALVLVTLGSLLQGSIGFGLAAVIAPVLLLLNPVFLPAPVIVAAMLLTSLIAWRDRQHAVWPEVFVGTAGRAVGMLPAAMALKVMSSRGYDIVFSVAVLSGVLISMAGWHFRLTLRNLFLTAIGSGFVNTVSAVGGPPLALVYQHEEAPKIRGTLNAIFTLGAPISLAGLWWAGHFGLEHLIIGLLLMPAIVVGFTLSRYTAERLNPAHTRPAILALSAMTALVVLIRALVAGG